MHICIIDIENIDGILLFGGLAVLCSNCKLLHKCTCAF